MKKHLLFFFNLFSFFLVTAQNPALPIRENLTISLLSDEKIFTDAAQRDTIQIPIPSHTSEYSLEVKAFVNSASGRGLDIEARDSLGKGFRTSINTSTFNWSSSLSNIQPLVNSDYIQERTFRYAVKDGIVHIYQDNSFLISKALEDIKDLNSLEQEENPFSYGNDIIGNWAGPNKAGTGKPIDYGWYNSAIDNSNSFWNTANGSGGVRYIDVTSTSSPVHTLNERVYSDRLLVVRYEGELASSVFSYPVTLEANTAYEFSFVHEHWNNGTIGALITAGISKTRTDAGYQVSSFTTTTKNVLQEANFRFISQEAGQYYITFTGATGTMFGIGDLSLKSYSKLEPRFVFGKNYMNGAVDMKITAITFDNAAYAPAEESTNDLLITNQNHTTESFNNKSVVVRGKSEVHLTGTTPLVNSTIDLQSEDSWVFLKDIKPSRVKSTYLSSITINGASFVDGVNGRVAIYAHGTVLMPHSSDLKPLTVYTEENFTGESMQCELHTYYRSLGSFDNKIKSFKLKRGYAVTFANNSDGTGYSRMFTADSEDIEISIMPDFLHETVSFIRVFKYHWVSKKGWAGSSTDAGYLNCTWYYNWSADGDTSADVEFVPHKHKVNWPGWGLNDKHNITHVLGLNEPDRPDQANATYEATMNIMPDFYKSGLRVTSPVAADFYNSWGQAAFIRECDTLNYRMDITTVHAYQTAGWWNTGRMNDISTRTNGRPIWITEWNNGANWTTETWPSGNRLATDANVQKQLNELKTILNILDNHPKVERYSFYNWVEDCRALILTINDSWKNNNPNWENYQWLKTAPVMWEDTNSKIVLTPAGEYYKNNKAPVAYSKANEKIPDWNVPYIEISSILLSDNEHIRLNWKNLNDELIASYTIEVKREGESIFSELLTVTPSETFAPEVELFNNAQYRLRVNAAKSSKFRYSNTIVGIKDPVLKTPVLTGEVLSISIINLSWNEVENSRSYKLLRSKEREGNYIEISSNINTSILSFQDAELDENTIYYYKLIAMNYAGEFESNILELKTKELILPKAVEGVIAYSADSKVTLNWDFIYDVKYKILRSESNDGSFSEVANNLNATQWINKGLENGKRYFYKVLAFNEKGESSNADIVEGQPKQGLHAYFDFEEKDGNTAYDQWGGNHGTFMSGADRRPGKIGSKSLSMNGTTNSYLQLPNGIVNTLTNFTITTWILLTSNNQNNCVFSFGNGSEQHMTLSPNVDGKIRFKFISGNMEVTFDVEHELPLTTWTHLSVKKAGLYVYVYVNGVRVGISNPVVLLPYAMGNTTQNYIGKSQSVSNPVFNGRIDDFRIYNYGLSDDEIICTMNNDCNTSSNKTIQSELDWLIYPNPTTDMLYIDLMNNTIIDNFVIYNISGQKMIQETTDKKQSSVSINTSVLPKGIYFLQIECDGYNSTKQFIKK